MRLWWRGYCAVGFSQSRNRSHLHLRAVRDSHRIPFGRLRTSPRAHVPQEHCAIRFRSLPRKPRLRRHAPARRPAAERAEGSSSNDPNPREISSIGQRVGPSFAAASRHNHRCLKLAPRRMEGLATTAIGDPAEVGQVGVALDEAVWCVGLFGASRCDLVT